jgi:protein tyrosine phosphatase (PTP) superfamily phosphohydrolase (DUF442 family)
MLTGAHGRDGGAHAPVAGFSVAVERVRAVVRANATIRSQRGILARCRGGRTTNEHAIRAMQLGGELILVDGCFRLGPPIPTPVVVAAAICDTAAQITTPPDPVEVEIARTWLARHARRRAKPSARCGSRLLSTWITRWADQPVSAAAVIAAARALGLDERPARTRPGVVLFAARRRPCGVECELFTSDHSRASCESPSNTPMGSEDSTRAADLACFEAALTRATSILVQLTAATTHAVDVLERVERLLLGRIEP